VNTAVNTWKEIITFWRRELSLVTAGIRTRNRPARSLETILTALSLPPPPPPLPSYKIGRHIIRLWCIRL